MAALKVRNLCKRFGSFEALRNISLEIDSGEFVVLVGPSGCGKSTLLNVVAGLEKLTEGEIEIGGKRMTHLPPRDRDIAMVFQSYALYPSMTARENITFGMRCRHVPRRAQEEAVARVSQLLQITSLLDRKPSQLSGGQRQRVAIGRALVRDPVLFLFDEPLSNLDAKLRVEMRMEIKQLHHRIGRTTVYVTHDQVEAMTLASRVAVMHQGEVLQFAEPDTVYNDPVNLFVARFMGSPPMNLLPAHVQADAAGLSAVIGQESAEPIRVRLPARYRTVPGLDGRQVVLGIRPECVVEAGRHANGDDASSIEIEAPVIVTEPMGAETVVVMSVAGERLLGRISPDIRLKDGELGRFSINTRKACLFDPATEQRIAAAGA
jgi:multiple sugar transport system ATP-binding protein